METKALFTELGEARNNVVPLQVKQGSLNETADAGVSREQANITRIDRLPKAQLLFAEIVC